MRGDASLTPVCLSPTRKGRKTCRVVGMVLLYHRPLRFVNEQFKEGL